MKSPRRTGGGFLVGHELWAKTAWLTAHGPWLTASCHMDLNSIPPIREKHPNPNRLHAVQTRIFS